ncbi:DNA phosphorothioation-dependent restriction protein DptF [Thiomicrorhabdus indica]|uniref:DNA phosphorothioation-dependent restriction protein DptF n=1 Tax=Thiomicrorhabdus indica TaxID=2267253 RepID=UPI00102D9588|nr:DNA phosphorothioation-dependent restriction protein DptF [Thiomicrorhabdus indica]
MKLQNLVDQLSKSSPNAVFTANSNSLSERSIHDYLYIETEIESDFIRLLEGSRAKKKVIFLCGSSGDGKSALIGRNINNFESFCDFHIDATHSFSPTQSAIEALDQRFDEFKANNRSLVVGINIGILLNYAKEGADSHLDIRKDINDFVDKGVAKGIASFINFEDYSKFSFSNGTVQSKFIRDLFQKVFDKNESNPFYSAYLNDVNNGEDSQVHKNFRMLSFECVQKLIVELLIDIHLKYEQFLTARSLLDFLYGLLVSPRIPSTTLFESSESAIFENLRKEDPCLIREEQIDTLILEARSNKKLPELEFFLRELNDVLGAEFLAREDVATIIRTMYLFKEYSFESSYIERYKKIFDRRDVIDFLEIIDAHREENDRVIQDFYSALESAVMSYANKSFPTLTDRNLVVLTEINDHALCSNVEFDVDWDAIASHEQKSLHNFPCCLKINDEPLSKFDFSLEVCNLINSINKGYRPNKHDRNTVIIFEELIEHIIDKAKSSNKIVIVKDSTAYEFKNSGHKIKVSKHAS